MAGHQEMHVSDPRNDANTLTVRFAVDAAPVAPHGYREHFDPGSGAEFRILNIWNASGSAARIRCHRHLERIADEIERRAFP